MHLLSGVCVIFQLIHYVLAKYPLHREGSGEATVDGVAVLTQIHDV